MKILQALTVKKVAKKHAQMKQDMMANLTNELLELTQPLALGQLKESPNQVE
jgi:hypothetical protein